MSYYPHKYLVTYAVTVESETPLDKEQVEDQAWNIMESTYVEPGIDDISDEITEKH